MRTQALFVDVLSGLEPLHLPHTAVILGLRPPVLPPRLQLLGSSQLSLLPCSHHCSVVGTVPLLVALGGTFGMFSLPQQLKITGLSA